MGIGTILKSKRCILMAWGENKAPIVQKAIEEEISDHVPATCLQNHQNTSYILEESASTEMSRIQNPVSSTLLLSPHTIVSAIIIAVDV